LPVDVDLSYESHLAEIENDPLVWPDLVGANVERVVIGCDSREVLHAFIVNVRPGDEPGEGFRGRRSPARRETDFPRAVDFVAGLRRGDFLHHGQSVRVLCEYDEHAAIRGQSQRNPRSTVIVSLERARANLAGVGHPELQRLVRHAEDARNILPAIGLVADKVDVRVRRAAVNVVQRVLDVAARRIRCEIRADPAFFEDVTQGLAPNDPALAAGVLFDGPAIAGAPQAVGDLPDFGVPADVVGQAVGPRRFATDHGGAVFDHLLDLLQNVQVDVLAFGQDEQFVTHSVGQCEAAILDSHPGEDDLGVGDVIVVAETQGRIDLLGRHEVVALVAVIVTHVGDEQALLEQVGAPREVVDPRFGLGPPRDARADVGSGVIDPTGPIGRRGIVRRRVEREVVRAVTEGAVGDGLEFERPILPVPPARERLHIDLTLAVDVGGAGGLFDDPDIVLLPELASRDVERPERLQCIDGHLVEGRAGTARFGAQQQTMLV